MKTVKYKAPDHMGMDTEPGDIVDVNLVAKDGHTALLLSIGKRSECSSLFFGQYNPLGKHYVGVSDVEFINISNNLGRKIAAALSSK